MATVRWIILLPLLLVVGVVAAAPLLLPLPGLLLVDLDPVQPADVALVLDRRGAETMQGAERWRQAGVVDAVVIVETPVRTHALVTSWSELRALGLAADPPTPAEHLRIVRADSGSAVAQAAAALPALRALGARSVLVPSGPLASRLTRREVARVLEPAGIAVHVAPFGPPEREPGHWYQRATDRRSVLTMWLELLVPALSGDIPATAAASYLVPSTTSPQFR